MSSPAAAIGQVVQLLLASSVAVSAASVLAKETGVGRPSALSQSPSTCGAGSEGLSRGRACVPRTQDLLFFRISQNGAGWNPFPEPHFEQVLPIHLSASQYVVIEQNFFFFFFWLHLQHVEIPKPGMEFMPQQWPGPLQSQRQILKPTEPQMNGKNLFFFFSF